MNVAYHASDFIPAASTGKTLQNPLLFRAEKNYRNGSAKSHKPIEEIINKNSSCYKTMLRANAKT